MRPLRVLVVDDHEVVRMGLRLLLRGNPNFELVGEASTAEEALRLVDLTRPDLVVLDVRLPDSSGIEACREIRTRHPDTQVLILTAYADDDFVTGAVQAGAAGYVLKRAGSQELLQALEALARGEAILDPAVTRAVLSRLEVEGRTSREAAFRGLSRLELEILGRVAEGKTNREIAAELYLAEKTVRNYVSRILTKLGFDNRVEAAAFAIRHRIHDLLAREGG